MFCGQDLKGNRAKEHIVPSWLQSHLGISNLQIEPAHFSFINGIEQTTGVEERSRRSLVWNAFVSGRVCRYCNGGWMRDLETQNQSTIKRLITEPRNALSLTCAAGIHLARWAAKTAYVLHEASNYARTIPKEHYEWMVQNDEGLPPGVCTVAKYSPIWIPADWLQWPVWQGETDSVQGDEETRSLTMQSYKIGLQFGHLMICVFWWPDDNVVYQLQRGMRSLWPVNGPACWLDNIEDTLPDKRVHSHEILAKFLWDIWVLDSGIENGHQSAGPVNLINCRYPDTRP